MYKVFKLYKDNILILMTPDLLEQIAIHHQFRPLYHNKYVIFKI